LILGNFTPFVPMLFAARDVADEDFWVLVVKGTFRIVPGKKAQLDVEQAPIAMTDQFTGEPHASSLRMEDDLAPFKKRADVVVNAIARAPKGRAARRWPLRVRVGALEKTLTATGPRAWVRTMLGYELSEPEPCTEVPIQYERAFGGVWRSGRGDDEVFEENPLGVGYVKADTKPKTDVIVAPQIEDPSDPIGKLGRRHRPAGIGPLTRSWLPRRRFAGTPDERWKEERWPNLPRDFDDAFYNCAHPDLVAPGYLSGDEHVELEGLDEKLLRFRLPGVVLSALRMPGSQRFAPVLDTLHIDVPAAQLHLTWRLRVPSEPAFEALGIRASFADG
jgi:hypothetical protein